MTPEQRRDRFDELIEVIDHDSDVLATITKCCSIAQLEALESIISEEHEMVYWTEKQMWIWIEDDDYTKRQGQLFEGDENEPEVGGES